jgi:phosphoribosylanthranilate isomerase
MVKIKICGLSRIEDIEAVNTYNPEFIGFVFAESKRKITPEKAKELRKLLSTDIIPVGVFVNADYKDILPLVNNRIIDMIQLHGQEDEDYIKRLKNLTDKPVIKAGISQVADYLLFDGSVPGSGETFDWTKIEKTQKPFFLAGGLNPENVSQAIKIATPFAVDVSSGVEVNNVKDYDKIKEFIRRARNEC